jgi:hypothetical protein
LDALFHDIDDNDHGDEASDIQQNKLAGVPLIVHDDVSAVSDLQSRLRYDACLDMEPYSFDRHLHDIDDNDHGDEGSHIQQNKLAGVPLKIHADASAGTDLQ